MIGRSWNQGYPPPVPPTWHSENGVDREMKAVTLEHLLVVFSKWTSRCYKGSWVNEEEQSEGTSQALQNAAHH